ncbi:MAG: hypothetical protein IID40_01305 [Planctomycetes bacterium]|nr:hypothetical protein [Planctomycetota bacterium]
MGLADSPLADLIVVKLARNPELVLLSRADIAKILSEQALVLAMDVSTRQARRNWGKVLRADLLAIMLARSVDDRRIIDLHVVETRHGLRLTREAFVWDDQTEATADRIARRIGQLGRKLEAGFDRVFAVPPFTSGDLLYDFGHLKRSYARVVGAALSQLPGAIVVEFEQAREIARELALSAGHPSVERSLPLYVYGRFRNQGAVAQRRVDLRLELRQGDKTLHAVERAGLEPDEVASYLRSVVLEFAGTVLDRESPAARHEADPTLEADLLEQRVEVFRLTGEWEEVAQLAEACLLLDPERVRLHFRIFEASIRLMFDSGLRREKPLKWPIEAERFSRHLSARQRRQYALAGIEHFGQYVRHLGLPLAETYEIGRYWHGTRMGAYPWDRDPDKLRELQRAIGRAKLEVTLTILRQGRFGNEDLGLQFLAQYAPFTFMPGAASERKEYYDALRRIMLAFDRYDRGLWHQKNLLLHFLGQRMYLELRGAVADEELAEFLDRLEAESTGSAAVAARIVRIFHRAQQGADAQSAIDAIDALIPKDMITDERRGWLIGNLKIRLGLGKNGPPGEGWRHEPLRVEDLRFTPILLRDRNDQPVNAKWTWCSQWYNCGSAGEILRFGLEPLRLMRKSGMVETCSGILEFGRGTPDGIAWDGRHLWLAGRDTDRQIRVINLETLEVVAVFGRADGVLPTTGGCKLAALTPGRVCAVGAFVGRTWVGILTLDIGPQGQISKSVDVFHEARTVADPVVPPETDEFEPDYAFRAQELITVPRTDSAYPWVLARRYIGLHNYYPGPLIIDPAARTVDVVPTSWGLFTSAMVVGERVLLAPISFYRLQGGFRTASGPTIAWAEPPQFTPRGIESVRLPNVARVGKAGSAVYRNGSVHWVSEKWVTVNVERGKVTRDLPLPRALQLGRLVVSDRYGLVLYATHFEPWGAWRVEFVDGQGGAETREFPQPPGKQSPPAESK